jgi:hypothetical protein
VTQTQHVFKSDHMSTSCPIQCTGWKPFPTIASVNGLNKMLWIIFKQNLIYISLDRARRRQQQQQQFTHLHTGWDVAPRKLNDQAVKEQVIIEKIHKISTRSKSFRLLLAKGKNLIVESQSFS